MLENVKKSLDDDGFAVIEGFLSENEVLELKQAAENLLKSMPDRSHRTVFCTRDSEKRQNRDEYFLNSAQNVSYFFEACALDESGRLLVPREVSLNKIGHALHDLDPVFRRITFGEKVQQCARKLGFRDPAVVQSMYIFKNPGLGGEVVPHQDGWYLHTEPSKLVGFWLGLEDATVENGCLWFSKGSHKSGIHRRFIRNPDKEAEELLIYTAPAPVYDTGSFTPVPVPKGSLVLIDGQAVHFSEPNKSTRSRHAYTFHLVEQKDTEYSKENWLQPTENPFSSLYTK